jgi:GT2 family glycosyltransferase
MALKSPDVPNADCGTRIAAGTNMTESFPLVTVLIATKDRVSELELTLREMSRQKYPSLEMLVIDDGSRDSVEPAVRANWPGSIVVRHEKNAGQCARRNEGFALAKGEFILQLDDDCSIIDPTGLAKAVRLLQDNPDAGALTFYIVNSLLLPDKIDTSSITGGCVPSFVGAAVLFRKSALDQTAGYRAFFGNEWEEEELGLQLLRRGSKIIFAPQIIAHHRLSILNRNSPRTWMRGLRNRSWAMVIHMPFPRIVFELMWKITLGAWDAIRLQRIRLFFQALSEAITGAPNAWRLRDPLSAVGLRRYDQLRLNPAITREEFDNPPRVSLKVFRGFWGRWHNRARNRNVWDRESGDIGHSHTVAYVHEERFKSAEPTTKIK